MIHSPSPSPSKKRPYRHFIMRAKERYNISLLPGEVKAIEDCIRRRKFVQFYDRKNNAVSEWIVQLDKVLGLPYPCTMKVRYCHYRKRVVTVVF